MKPLSTIAKKSTGEIPLENQDLLLDALTETDVKAAPIRRISNTLIAAIAISCLCIWLTIHTIHGGAPVFQLAGKSQTGPLVSRLDARMHARRAKATKDPTATYIAQAKRGMTDQEIRWMLEDFQQVGKMPTYGFIEPSRTFREKQNQWYLTALSEALSLTPEQKRMTAISLTGLLDQAEEKIKAQVNEAVARGEQPGGLVMEPYVQANFRLRQSEFSPWNLCELTEEQSALTMKESRLKQKIAAVDMVSPWNQWSMGEGSMSLAMKDPTSGEFIDYPPPSFFDTACRLVGTIKGGLIDITQAFPLMPNQKLVEHRNDLLAQARLLQPAQLRMALLVNPMVASLLEQQLNPTQATKTTP